LSCEKIDIKEIVRRRVFLWCWSSATAPP